ncbi:glutamine-rich protein 2-like [Pithys albifrons albifrons]|uniref:glutamine-rich protein 2-like n=1 Tax=Pithys albifrons albifrons TaxID=3385563 RepID=UPI003A5D0D58
MKATQFSLEEEIQRIKEALSQATDLCKDLCKEVSEMKATQSHMEEDIQMIQKALGQGNLQDAVGQSLALSDQSAPTKPHFSDMDTLGSCPDNQSTTPGIQTETSSDQSSTTSMQPGSQADHPAVERITRDLSELQGQVSSLQGLASDLQGEKEKIRELKDALGKLHVADSRDQISHLRSALQEIKQEQKELRKEQEIIKATLKQLVTANELQKQLDELRAVVRSMGQKQPEASSPDHSSDTKVLKKLLHNYEKLQKQVDSLVPQQVQRPLPQKSQDEELLKSIQATIVRVEGDCEQLGYVTGSLRDDHRQQQKDIEALFRSLEGLEKKADKEDLLLLKENKVTLGSKVSCTQFEASMEHLEERMQEILKRVLGQEQHLQEVQQQFCDALGSKLDRLELGPFQKQLQESWERMIKELKDQMSTVYDDAAGIKQQLLVPYKCLSCDRDLNMQVPGPHIDTLPFYPPLPISHGAHPTAVMTEEQAQQHGYRKVANSRFHLKSQSCRGQNMSNAQHKDFLWVSKKPGVSELLSTDNLTNHHREHGPNLAAQDKLGPTALREHRPASDPGH